MGRTSKFERAFETDFNERKRVSGVNRNVSVVRRRYCPFMTPLATALTFARCHRQSIRDAHGLDLGRNKRAKLADPLIPQAVNVSMRINVPGIDVFCKNTRLVGSCHADSN